MRTQHRFADFNLLGMMIVEMIRGKKKKNAGI
jgi:hypothetical protein